MASTRVIMASTKAGPSLGAGVGPSYGTSLRDPANKKHSCSPQQQQLNAAKQSRLWLAAAAGNMDALIDNLHASYGGVALLDLQDDQGCSPLLIACQEGHLEVVHTLLSAGANADLQDHFGVTPLFSTSQAGHVEVVRAILSNGRAQVPVLYNCYYTIA